MEEFEISSQESEISQSQNLIVWGDLCSRTLRNNYGIQLTEGKEKLNQLFNHHKISTLL